MYVDDEMKILMHGLRTQLFTVIFLASVLWAQQTASPALHSSAQPAQTPTAPQNSSAQQRSEPGQTTVQFPEPINAREIVRQAVEMDHHNFERAQKYTCVQREVIKHLDKHGNVKSTEIKTYDVNFYFGESYEKLVQINDKPLTEKEQKKEDEKLEKFLAKHRDESPGQREKRLEKQKKEREEGRAFVHDVVNAYDFRLVGNDQVSGEDTWVIEAVPRQDFKPTQPHADILKKIKGRIWIEKKDYNWAKVEAEATDTISFGFFLFRIHPGSRFVLETAHINNELWALHRLYINGSARIALLKNETAEQEDVFSNYKKFSSTVTILPGVKEIPPR